MQNIKIKKVYPRRGGKVFVGLSGGVDSAVSAALLKEDGFDVTGVFIKAWTPEGYPCAWKEDRRSAMRVAAVLNIPFITLDLEKEYKREVVDYMIREYKAGRTPNPDVMCNKEIKFGHFLKFAIDKGADFVATGHYARISEAKLYRKVLDKSLAPLCGEARGLFERSFSVQLLEGADKNKDQSYFLWTLTEEQLKHILFPIGHLQKSEVRKLAHKFGLPQETRKDSQGLCFLGKVDMKEFLSRYIQEKKGEVLDQNGEVIGFHNGATFFTIGERHGFTITQKNTHGSPVYVVAKDVVKNTITVAPRLHHSATDQKIFGDTASLKELILQEVNLPKEISNQNLSCRIRYRGEKIPCKILGNKAILSKPEMVSAGQSLVIYQDEICLGGGIIA